MNTTNHHSTLAPRVGLVTLAAVPGFFIAVTSNDAAGFIAGTIACFGTMLYATRTLFARS